MIIVLESPADARRDEMVGEQSGMLRRDETIDRLIPLLEPAMMVILGGLIAVLLLAMYLPLFQMGSVFG